MTNRDPCLEDLGQMFDRVFRRPGGALGTSLDPVADLGTSETPADPPTHLSFSEKPATPVLLLF